MLFWFKVSEVSVHSWPCSLCPTIQHGGGYVLNRLVHQMGARSRDRGRNLGSNILFKATLPTTSLPGSPTSLHHLLHWSVFCYWDRSLDMHNLKADALFWVTDSKDSVHGHGSKVEIPWRKGMAGQSYSAHGIWEAESQRTVPARKGPGTIVVPRANSQWSFQL